MQTSAFTRRAVRTLEKLR